MTSFGRWEYRVMLCTGDSVAAENRIREVIERTRGDLHTLTRQRQHASGRLELLLGPRHIDDVVTGLEGAGFDVAAVVARQVPAAADQPPALRWRIADPRVRR